MSAVAGASLTVIHLLPSSRSRDAASSQRQSRKRLLGFGGKGVFTVSRIRDLQYCIKECEGSYVTWGPLAKRIR